MLRHGLLGDAEHPTVTSPYDALLMIVAIVELTKIPLATAVYYSARFSWRIVFIIGLLLVNVSTFETIVTGFERINRERTKVVSNYITEYLSLIHI